MYSILLFALGVLLHVVAAIVVPVEQGLLEGDQKWTITGNTFYSSFKGIPYAAPPIGELRFKAPKPALPWKGIRNATAHGNVCPQVNQLSNVFIPGSEDCLFLNVYTPNMTPDSLLPVIFFIHGGGYSFGSGNDDNYGPDFLIDRNVIVVTFNYRLDSLGFICLNTKEVPGNAGMKDQVAALKWVQKNIQNFGGDPNEVTIFGQSAGGASCTLHTLSPMSKGLFRRAIAMSGVAISEFSIPFEQQYRSLVFGKRLGLETTNTSQLLLFLQSVPVNQLIGTSPSTIAIEDFISIAFLGHFVPVVEEDFGQERFLIESHSNVSFQNHQKHEIDILLGYTTAEMVAGIAIFERLNTLQNYSTFKEVLVPRNIIYRSTPKTNLELADMILEYYSGSQVLSLKTMAQLVTYSTDIYNHDVIRYARHLSENNDNVYLYQFSCMSERNVLSTQGFKYGIYGVAHIDDLMYVFNANKYNLPVDKNATSYKMIRNTCTLLTNFAKYGNPTPDLSLGVQWPKFNVESQIYLDIGEQLVVGTNPNAGMIDFWKNVYERAGLQF